MKALFSIKKGKDYRVERNPVPRDHSDISSICHYPGTFMICLRSLGAYQKQWIIQYPGILKGVGEEKRLQSDSSTRDTRYKGHFASTTENFLTDKLLACLIFKSQILIYLLTIFDTLLFRTMDCRKIARIIRTM